MTEDSRTRWWTWAGGRANAVLTAALETADPTLVDDDYVVDNRQIGLRSSVSGADLRRAIHEVQARFVDLGARASGPRVRIEYSRAARCERVVNGGSL